MNAPSARSRPGAADALLQLRGISKEFPNGTAALRDVDFTVEAGSVHGLVGANGAGKSTLIKIVSGAERPSSGTLTLEGRTVSGWTPGEARSAGVGTVYQNVPLVPTMNVVENVLLGQERQLRISARERLDTYLTLGERIGVDIDASALVGDLTIGQRQMVGLLQVLALGAKLIILDEPTASLSQTERDVVARVVRRLSERDGVAFIYISHHLNEVLALTESVTVLRDGRLVARYETSKLDTDELVLAMTGEELLAVENAPTAAVDESTPVVLEGRDLVNSYGLDGASISVRVGEVVGIFGVMGSGRTELLRALFGADRLSGGEVRIRDRRLPASTAAAVKAGIAFIPEDRLAQGVVADWELWRNTSLVDLDRFLTRGAINGEAELGRALDVIGALEIVTGGPEQTVATLSGGNQQKVVFGKWLFGQFDVFLLDEPTVAIDVTTKAQILRLVRRLASEGKSVIINSSEPEELLGVADRIVVVRAGRIVGERRADATTESELIAMAGGLHAEEAVGVR